MPRRKDGGRHLNIGRSGTGKSYLTRALLAELNRGGRWIFTLDDKDATGTQYPGIEYVTVADFEADPPPKEGDGSRERRIVFRGDLRKDIVCPAEDVAQLGKRFAQKGIPVCVNFDELRRAAAGKSGQHWTAPTVPWLLMEGRALGCWWVGSTQSAKLVPDAALNEAGTISVFCQKRKAARYIVDVLELDDELATVIPELDEGEFVLLAEEEDWNGHVYRL